MNEEAIDKIKSLDDDIQVDEMEDWKNVLAGRVWGVLVYITCRISGVDRLLISSYEPTTFDNIFQ